MATPFGREIDSDILISSSSGSGTPIIFLSKINLPLWKCQSSPVRRRDATLLFCWLIWWKQSRKMKTGASDRPFRPFHLRPSLPTLAFVWPKRERSCMKPPDIFILGKIKHGPPFQMTLLDTDTLLCLIKLINCLMDHKSAAALMGPGVLCWFKYFHITMSKVSGAGPALISTTSQQATYPAATCVTCTQLHGLPVMLKTCWKNWSLKQ